MSSKATHVPDYELSEVLAIRALSEGKANDVQQQQAFKFIIEKVCLTYGFVYEPNSFDLTAFHAGRTFVGQVLVGMLKPETLIRIRDIETKKHEKG